MAVKLKDEFGSRANPPDAAYPNGSLKDETNPGVSNDGSPLSSRVGNDFQGFMQSALAEAGIDANGNPDSVDNPQILNALKKVQENHAPTYAFIAYKASGGKSAVENMVSNASVGERCECDNGTRFIREGNASGSIEDFKLVGPAFVDDFGATPDSADCTTAYNFLINSLNDGDEIKWQPSKKYLGNFVTSKAFHLDINHSKLINVANDNYILAMINDTVTEHSVTETELNRNDDGFTVAGALGLFSVGDIGYLWDSAKRPADDGDVNFECVKISEINGDAVSVEGGLCSYKGAGAIKFYHQTNQKKDCSVKNLNIECTDSFAFIAGAIMGFETVRHENIEVVNSYFDSFTVRYCYDVIGKDTRPLKPRETALGGTGYGLNYRVVTKYNVESVKGNGCRHAYDQDSAYRGHISIIEDPNDQSSCCALGHNGFTSDLTVEKVTAKGLLYPVSTSDQGFGTGDGRALKENHPLVNVKIETVRGKIPPTKTADEFNVAGVYLRNNTDNVHISDVKWTYLNSQSVTGEGSSGVRIDGIPIGNTSITGLDGNKIGKPVSVGASTGNVSNEILVIDDIYVNEVYKTARIIGRINFNIDNISHDSVVSDSLIVSQDGATGNIDDYSVFIGGAIRYKGDDKTIYTNKDGLRAKGNIDEQSRTSYASVDVGNSTTMTLGQLQNKSKLIRMVAPDSGSYTVSQSFIPTPEIDGQKATITAVRGNITLPAGGTLDRQVVINQGETARFVSITSLWRLT